MRCMWLRPIVIGTPLFGRDRTDLGCWLCRRSIPDENPECSTCWWRRCGCGACRQPIHRDTRGRVGPCPEEVKRLGSILRIWAKTFDGQPLDWPTTAEEAAGAAIRNWLADVSSDLGVRIRLLDSKAYHPAFGLRLQVPTSLSLLHDPRVPALLRGASNMSGLRDVMVERPDGDRVSFVLGEGTFCLIGGSRHEAPGLRTPEALEALEADRLAIHGAVS